MAEASKAHEGGLADVARIVLDHLQNPNEAPRALYLEFGGWRSHGPHDMLVPKPVCELLFVRKGGLEAWAVRLVAWGGKPDTVLFQTDKLTLALKLVQASVICNSSPHQFDSDFWANLKPDRSPNKQLMVVNKLMPPTRWYDRPELLSAVEFLKEAYSPVLYK